MISTPLLSILRTRIQQKYRTISYPRGTPPPLPDRFLGKPEIGSFSCPSGCDYCLKECPTGSLFLKEGKIHLDTGTCLFCGVCSKLCPAGMIQFGNEYRLAARERSDLLVSQAKGKDISDARHEMASRIFKRSLKLRQVSAGGCAACEADCNVLTTIGWDIGRFGIQFVASPRHADGLLITGPVTENMKLALEKTYRAVPHPKIVLAVGSCAIGGGPYRDHPEQLNGAGSVLPIDLYIPGCPPHPLTILDGILRFLDKIPGREEPWEL